MYMIGYKFMRFDISFLWNNKQIREALKQNFSKPGRG